MAWRGFVLEPAPRWLGLIHPAIGATIRQLHEHLQNARRTTRSPTAGSGNRPGRLTGPCGRRRLLSDAGAASLRQLAGLAGSAPKSSYNSFAAGRAARRALAVWREQPLYWVSDFWFGQTVAYARMALTGSRLEEVIRRWRSASSKTAPQAMRRRLTHAAWCARRVASPSPRRGSKVEGSPRFGLRSWQRSAHPVGARAPPGRAACPVQPLEELSAAVARLGDAGCNLCRDAMTLISPPGSRPRGEASAAMSPSCAAGQHVGWFPRGRTARGT